MKDITEANKLTKKFRSSSQSRGRGHTFPSSRPSFTGEGNQKFHPYQQRYFFFNRSKFQVTKKRKRKKLVKNPSTTTVSKITDNVRSSQTQIVSSLIISHQPTIIAGRLVTFIDRWKQITSDPTSNLTMHAPAKLSRQHVISTWLNKPLLKWNLENYLKRRLISPHCMNRKS